MERPFVNYSSLRGVVIGILLLVLLSFIGTLGYVLIEGWSVFDAMYMTVVTISTVGFGETYELSRPGRIFTLIFILVSLGTSIYTFTRLGQLIFEGELVKYIGARKMKNQLEKLQNHFIICGYGKVGKTVAKELLLQKMPFVVIDHDQNVLESLNAEGVLHLSGDATDESILRRAGIEKASALLCVLPTDADNLYLVISARELRPGLNIISKALNEKAESRLRQAGATSVISPYRIAGYHMLHAAVSPNILKYLEIRVDKGHSIGMQEIQLSQNSPLVNRSIKELEIRKAFGISIIAIKRAKDELIVNPDAEEKLLPDDILVASGSNGSLTAFSQKCS